MKLKLTEWTAEDGTKHLIVLFQWSAAGGFHTYELKGDGNVAVGPKIPMDQLIGGANCRCRELEAFLTLT